MRMPARCWPSIRRASTRVTRRSKPKRRAGRRSLPRDCFYAHPYVATRVRPGPGLGRCIRRFRPVRLRGRRRAFGLRRPGRSRARRRAEPAAGPDRICRDRGHLDHPVQHLPREHRQPRTAPLCRVPGGRQARPHRPALRPLARHHPHRAAQPGNLTRRHRPPPPHSRRRPRRASRSSSASVFHRLSSINDEYHSGTARPGDGRRVRRMVQGARGPPPGFRSCRCWPGTDCR